MTVGTGGGANILPTKKMKSLKITTYKSGMAIRIKQALSSVVIVNHLLTNVQNRILSIWKCNTNKFCAASPIFFAQSQIRSYGFVSHTCLLHIWWTCVSSVDFNHFPWCSFVGVRDDSYTTRFVHLTFRMRIIKIVTFRIQALLNCKHRIQYY